MLLLVEVRDECVLLGAVETDDLNGDLGSGVVELTWGQFDHSTRVRGCTPVSTATVSMNLVSIAIGYELHVATLLLEATLPWENTPLLHPLSVIPPVRATTS